VTAWAGCTVAPLAGDRLHIQHGPIDLIVWADAAPLARARCYEAAVVTASRVLAALVAELPVLRAPLGTDPPHVRSPVAQAMVDACWPHSDQFITPMAAVAGAVADHVLAALLVTGEVARAYVNNGGDIAVHTAARKTLTIGVVRDLALAVPEGHINVQHGSGIGGIATSGWRGRSFSLGIADAVTVLAGSAAMADAAATIIANAVNLDNAHIRRQRAVTLDPDSDLGERLVTVGVPDLPAADIERALSAGVAVAERLRARGLILAALLALQGRWRAVQGDTLAIGFAG
jgi:hypothetical protein